MLSFLESISLEGKSPRVLKPSPILWRKGAKPSLFCTKLNPFPWVVLLDVFLCFFLISPHNFITGWLVSSTYSFYRTFGCRDYRRRLVFLFISCPKVSIFRISCCGGVFLIKLTPYLEFVFRSNGRKSFNLPSSRKKTFFVSVNLGYWPCTQVRVAMFYVVVF
jgi:hypothetical protein